MVMVMVVLVFGATYRGKYRKITQVQKEGKREAKEEEKKGQGERKREAQSLGFRV